MEDRKQEFQLHEPASFDKRSFQGYCTGYHKWITTDKNIINEILNAQNGELFESAEFMMANLRWKLLLYPNGHKTISKGSVIFGLKLVSLPTALANMTIAYTLYCKESMTPWSSIAKWTRSDEGRGCPNDAIQLSEWKRLNPESISIMTSIKILGIEFKKDVSFPSPFIASQTLDTVRYKYKTRYIDEINDVHVVNMMKNSRDKRRFASQLIDNLWKLSYTFKRENKYLWYRVGLSLCALPPNIKSITIEAKIRCHQAETDWAFNKRFTAQNDMRSKEFEEPGIVVEDWSKLTFELVVDVKKMEFVDGKNDFAIYEPIKISKMLRCMRINAGIETLECKMQELDEQIQDTKLLLEEKPKLEEVKEWLKDKVELPQYIDLFIEQKLNNLDVIKTINMMDELPAKIHKKGHRRKLIKEIERLKTQDELHVPFQGNQNDLHVQTHEQTFQPPAHVDMVEGVESVTHG